MIPSHLLARIVQKFIDLVQDAFDLVFGNVNFSVLWSWLPGDIGTAASAILFLLFAFALVNVIRRFLPF